jgi:hypothetical protein
MRSSKSTSILVAGVAVGLWLTAHVASAVPIAIVNPDYNGSISGWSIENPPSFGYDTPNAPGSVGGSIFWGDNTAAGPYWIYQTLIATASASNSYTLSVWFYNDRNTLASTGGNYKLELLTADGGETASTATLIGSSTINPATIPLNGWSQFFLNVDGATIPVGELGKSLMIAAETPQHTLWGYADQWSLNAFVPEPTSLSLILLAVPFALRRARH